MKTWADATVIIALERIGELALLRDALGEVFITPDVEAEVARRATTALRDALGSWIRTVKVRGDADRFRVLGLGSGEASLFLTPPEDLLLLDDLPARRVAETEGRACAGLLALIVNAVKRGILPVPHAKSMLDKLASGGFRMTVELYERILKEFQA